MLAKSQKIRGFDGIRGWAALAVVLHHTWIGHRSLGGMAVDLFFVLSGFLICGILHTARKRVDAAHTTIATELLHFWINRGLRIFPLYYCALALMLFVGVAFRVFPDLVHDAIWYVLYLQDFLIAFVTNDFGSFSHTWTLAIEQQFYVLFGVLMLCIPARRHLALLAATAAAVFAATFWTRSALPIPGRFVLPAPGFLPILAGGITAIIFSNKESTSDGRNGIAATFFCTVIVVLALLPSPRIAAHVPYWDIIPLIIISVSGSALLVQIAKNQNSIVTAILDMPASRWLGDLSYGIYVIHYPVRQALWLLPVQLGPFQTFAVVLPVTLALAQASRMLIERPALAMKYRVRRPKAWQITPSVQETARCDY